MPPAPSFTTGGTLDATQSLYVERQADHDLLQYCLDGEYAYVLSTRQIGKSSLMIRTAHKLREHGVRPVIIDLNTIGAEAVNAEQWFFSLLETIEMELNLETEAGPWWRAHPELSYVRRFQQYLQTVALVEVTEPIVIFIDEIEGTLKLDFSDDFFAAIRAVHEQRAHKPEFKRVSFVLIGSATPSELVSAAERTPFNIGKRVELTDFRDVDEAAIFLSGFDAPPEIARQTLEWVFAWTKGHPYLTQTACAELAKRETLPNSQNEVDALIHDLFLRPDSRDGNLKYVEQTLLDRPGEKDRDEVLSTYAVVLTGFPVKDDERSPIQSHLKLAWVVKWENRRLKVRNPIYRKVFNLRWVVQRLPVGDWWRRAPATVKVAGWAVGALLSILSLSTFWAVYQQDLAQQQVRMVQANLLAVRAREAGEEMPVSRLLFAVSAMQVQELDDSSTSLAHTVLRESLQNRLGVPLLVTSEFVSISALSPDGNWFAVAGSENEIQLWNLDTYSEEPIVLGGHKDRISSLMFSPDGRLLASGSWDDTVHLWDLTKLTQEPVILHGYENEIQRLIFSPDGHWLAVGEGIGRVYLWDITNLSNFPLILNYREANIFNLTFSQNGHWLVSSSGIFDDPVYLWDLKNVDKNPIVLTGQGTYPTFLFSPDGRWLVSKNGNSTVSMWDMKRLADEPKTIRYEEGFVFLRFSPDGRFLASGGQDFNFHNVLLWDMEDLSESPELLFGHEGRINSLIFSPDGRWLASGSDDKTIQMWRLADPSAEPIVFNGHETGVTELAFSPDGHWLVSGGGGSLLLWDIDNPLQNPTVLSHKEIDTTNLKFTPNGRWLLSGSRTIRIWDMNLQMHQPILLHENNDRVADLAFSPDGHWIASSSDASVHLWDIENLEDAPIELKGHEDSVISLSFSPDGHWLASGSVDKTARLWNMTDLDREPIVLQGHNGWVRVLAFSPDGHWLGSSGIYDTVVYLWNMDDLTFPYEILGQDKFVAGIAFSADGHWLASGGPEIPVHLWDLSNLDFEPVILPWYDENSFSSPEFSSDGRWLASNGGWFAPIHLWGMNNLERNPKLLRGHEGDVYGLTFDSDGSWLAGVSEDTLILWSLNTSNREGILLRGHQGNVTTLTFSPDGHWLVSGGEDKIIRLWNMSPLTYDPVVLSGHEGRISTLDFSPDGHWLASGGWDGTIRLWDMGVDSLIDKACRLVGRNFTQAEWTQYFPGEPYRKTCEQWPEGE